MGLHTAFNGSIKMLLMWYHSIPRTQRGKMHVIEVPTLILDTNRIRVPTWTVNPTRYREQYLRQVLPHTVHDGIPKRPCGERQMANHWTCVSTYELPTVYWRSPRMVCQTCYEMFRGQENEQRRILGNSQFSYSYSPTEGAIIWRDLIEAEAYGA